MRTSITSPSAPLAGALCPSGGRDRQRLLGRVGEAGCAVDGVTDPKCAVEDDRVGCVSLVATAW